jgi:hypothetical protein
MDIYPANGMVLWFLLLNIICNNNEKNNENTNKTKNETIEKQQVKKMKNNKSPIPILWLINCCFKMTLEYTQSTKRTVSIKHKLMLVFVNIVSISKYFC